MMGVTAWLLLGPDRSRGQRAYIPTVERASLVYNGGYPCFLEQRGLRGLGVGARPAAIAD